jgi:hypothetical protein
MILEMPLSEESIEKESGYLDSTNKWEILLEIQKLFIEMKLLDKISTSTSNMTKSFGWE